MAGVRFKTANFFLALAGLTFEVWLCGSTDLTTTAESQSVVCHFRLPCLLPCGNHPSPGDPSSDQSNAHFGKRVQKRDFSSITPSSVTLTPQGTSEVDIFSSRYPDQSVVWIRHEEGNGPAVRQDDSRYQLLSNQSLMINSTGVEDAGNFQCRDRSSNAVISRVTVTVFEPLKFIEEPTSMNQSSARHARFRCVVSGVPLPEVSWLRDQKPFAKAQRIFFNKLPPSMPNEVGEDLLIENVRRTDSGVYQCTARVPAKSGLKNQITSTEAILFVPPSNFPRPSKLRITELRSRSVRLTWNMDPPGEYQYSAEIVRLGPSPYRRDQVTDVADIVFTELEPNTQYRVAVSAVMVYGLFSDLSEPLEFSTPDVDSDGFIEPPSTIATIPPRSNTTEKPPFQSGGAGSLSNDDMYTVIVTVIPCIVGILGIAIIVLVFALRRQFIKQRESSRSSSPPLGTQEILAQNQMELEALNGGVYSNGTAKHSITTFTDPLVNGNHVKISR